MRFRMASCAADAARPRRGHFDLSAEAASQLSDDIALEGGVVLREPHVPLQHVIPVHQRQAGYFDPPANPTFLGGIERQGGRDLPAVDELRQDGLAESGGVSSTPNSKTARRRARIRSGNARVALNSG